MAQVKDKGHRAIEVLSKRLERLNIEYVPVDSLRPNSYNPNRQSEHDFELLKSSMETDGITQPVIVQKGTSVIVDGEHRWRAARALGYTEIPVVFVEMDEQQMKVSTLRHNRARGSEDIELTASILRDLEAVGAMAWAQNELMMDDVEVQRLLEDIAAPEALAAEEFSGAWIPEGTRMADESGDGKVREIGGAPALEGISAAAADARRETEKKIAAAKTEEERQQVIKEQDIHRVAFTYSGEEARVVKQALGANPAQKLLDMCRKEIGLT